MKNKEKIKEHQAWKEYNRRIKEYEKRTGEKIPEERRLSNLREFQEAFRAERYDENGKKVTPKKIVDILEYDTKYLTSRKTARAERKRYKEQLEKGEKEKFTLEDFQKMSTKETAELFKDDIMKKYKELKEKYKNDANASKKAAKEISQYYFGS